MAFDETQQKSREYSVKLYEQFLRYLRSQYAQNYWHALPREAAAHVAKHREIARSIERNSHDLLLAAETTSGSKLVNARIVPRVLENRWRLRGKRAAVLLFSYYPPD